MGKKYEMDCNSDNYGNQLFFNAERQVCDYGWNVTPENDLLEKCPPAGSSQTLRLAHECNCFKHYECHNGEAIGKTCQPGQMFDYILKKCVPAEKAMCKSGSSRMSPIGFETDIPSIFQCPPKGSHETKLIPHECFCNVYFRCEDGNAVREECPPGQDFDYEKQKCGLKEDVKCRRPIGTTPTTKTTTNTTTLKRDLLCNPGLRVPHECHCNEYYECAMNGLKQYLRKCEQGYNYDYERKVCDITSRAKCWRGHCVPDELLPHEYDCGKYYKCGPTGEKVVSQKCAEGYLFDCDLKTCVPQNRLGRCCVVIPPYALKQEDNEFLGDVL
ncbi:uncharacterized protein LOC128882465 [Hylaeus volcanicus]|uniref:uncharacterized protein LOC128882465 n=1 Tax=Hylaeus volcanicus TaxID=313075 RepID=UPI0023B8690F|nr:uncharacterized protein LOC128882465 [Hylaeus volcanicus]